MFFSFTYYLKFQVITFCSKGFSLFFIVLDLFNFGSAHIHNRGWHSALSDFILLISSSSFKSSCFILCCLRNCRCCNCFNKTSWRTFVYNNNKSYKRNFFLIFSNSYIMLIGTLVAICDVFHLIVVIFISMIINLILCRKTWKRKHFLYSIYEKNA